MSTPLHIAVLLTCFNRRDKTTACLRSLVQAYANFAQKHEAHLSVFLTDDGCTDGTAQAAKDVCQGTELHIVPGNGHLYWAGGMRAAWREALADEARSGRRWDFFLLLNDDTVLWPQALDTLWHTHLHCLEHFSKPGIYSGITCQEGHPEVITYSGDVFDSGAKGKWHRLGPSDVPQMVDQCNANILLVPREIEDRVGIFYEGYIHGAADHDYCMQVRRAGFPALITPGIAGECEYDHISEKEECLRLMRMTLGQRRKYVNHPTHSDKDYLLMVKRNIPGKYPLSVALRTIRLYCPRLYYYINKVRGLY